MKNLKEELEKIIESNVHGHFNNYLTFARKDIENISNKILSLIEADRKELVEKVITLAEEELWASSKYHGESLIIDGWDDLIKATADIGKEK